MMRRWVPIAGLITAGLLWLAGCHWQGAAKTSAPVLRPGHAGNLHNLYAIHPRVWSGSSPEGDPDFQALAGLGVKTVISVDGASPDVVAAGRHGLRYVHLPIGYDGIGPAPALRLAQAATVLPGPFYVHCHHGQHRGPAAAAVVARTLEVWTDGQVKAWLQTAGTSTNYPGLYRDAVGFRRPTRRELQADSGSFPSRAMVPDLVTTMVRVDGLLEDLKAVRSAGFRTPTENPDLVPEQTALQLLELYREAHRTRQGGTRGEPFQVELHQAEATASAFRDSLRELARTANPENQARVEAGFQQLQQDCVRCHRRFRN
jgi:protein tyrosine phosphatase (PTP) superfamily phosphohydrolase (DUF442 family)